MIVRINPGPLLRLRMFAAHYHLARTYTGRVNAFRIAYFWASK